MQIVLKAILWLTPTIGQYQAGHYARLIHHHSMEAGLDPLLVTSLIYHESRFKRYATNESDYGLMQLHVSKTSHTGYQKSPEMLYNPRVNIMLGIKLLGYWRRYHRRSCTNNHPWYSHYQHGHTVSSPHSGARVKTLLDYLIVRYRDRGPTDAVRKKASNSHKKRHTLLSSGCSSH